MRHDVFPDALWSRASEFIAQHTGLAFPGERRLDLQRGFAASAKELGLSDAAACAQMLLSASLTQQQLHVVASHLTIGETYFFRDKKTFDALAEHVLPELIGRRRGRGQQLRLWSAACSTGEEPYSLAILVRQLLPDWRDWTVTIWATDINDRSLQRAAAGIYGEWSFRGSEAGFKEKYFTPTPDGRFVIEPEIRGLVSFSHLNLAQSSLLSPAAAATGMDIILCRNVLIYFTPTHARRLADNLHRALGDGGWLAVSASECSQTLFPSFTAVNFPGAILYRKSQGEERGAKPWPAPAATQSNRDAPFEPPLPSLSAPRQDTEPLAGTPPPQTRDAMSLEAISLETRSLANQGRHADALSSSERWIASDKTDSAAHYVNAMILQEMGEQQGARDALQRAVYLQPDFALAYFALGNLARADARIAQANKHFTNALDVLRHWAPESLLPESDGLSAGRLVEIITTLIDQPHRSASAGASP